MTPEARKAADIYYAQSSSWAQERNDALRSSRRVAWIVAGVALVVALALAVALLLLMPLKTVVPYTLLVDRQTGYVQSLSPIESNRIAADSALTQSFLVQYVIAREGFDRATVQSDYKKVALWSADNARSSYLSEIQVSNPDSPLTRLPPGTTIQARIRSISSLGQNSALVRYETVQQGRNASAQGPRGWVALVSYRFSNAPMSVEDRFINPLGFQVTGYRRNAETPPISPQVNAGQLSSESQQAQRLSETQQP
jgi:type IV secretion system protein VirB8